MQSEQVAPCVLQVNSNLILVLIPVFHATCLEQFVSVQQVSAAWLDINSLIIKWNANNAHLEHSSPNKEPRNAPNVQVELIRLLICEPDALNARVMQNALHSNSHVKLGLN